VHASAQHTLTLSHSRQQLFTQAMKQHLIVTTTTVTWIVVTLSLISNISLVPLVSAMATSSTLRTAVGKLNPSRTCLLLCDVQERFRPLSESSSKQEK
jgi:hypothetical protein